MLRKEENKVELKLTGLSYVPTLKTDEECVAALHSFTMEKNEEFYKLTMNFQKDNGELVRMNEYFRAQNQIEIFTSKILPALRVHSGVNIDLLKVLRDHIGTRIHLCYIESKSDKKREDGSSYYNTHYSAAEPEMSEVEEEITNG